LTPELLTELEFGIESQLFERRIKLNASYYDRNANRQIIARPLDFSRDTMRRISMRNNRKQGFEVSLTVTPIRTGDWTWDITTNYTKNTSLVKSLPDGSKSVLTAGFTTWETSQSKASH